MRLRLLPLLMFALAGTVTVKIGSVWNARKRSTNRRATACCRILGPSSNRVMAA